MRRALVLIGLVAALALPAAAQAADDWSPEDLEQQLMCPTCNQRLDQSDSAVAERMRQMLRDWHDQGLTEEQARDRMVAQFGEQVLAAPPKEGFNLLAWLVPAAVLLAGAAIAGALVLAWSRSRRPPPRPAEEPLDDELEQRIDRELGAYE